MNQEAGAGEWIYPVLREVWQQNGAARAALLEEVRGLSEAQLAFRSVPGKWSIGEILDHLCLAERSMTRTISKILQRAAGLGQIGDPGAMPEPAFRIDLAAYNEPTTAPESALPSPDRPLERLVAGLVESRERLVEVARRMDGRVVGNVTLQHVRLGELTFYQWLALAGAHDAKHLDQIRRIRAHPGFPHS
jgi:hypothetical protein